MSTHTFALPTEMNLEIARLLALAEAVDAVQALLTGMVQQAGWGSLLTAALHYCGGRATADRIGETMEGWGYDFGGVSRARSVGAALGDWGGQAGIKQDGSEWCLVDAG